MRLLNAVGGQGWVGGIPRGCGKLGAVCAGFVVDCPIQPVLEFISGVSVVIWGETYAVPSQIDCVEGHYIAERLFIRI
jgi:hypothetical protein